MRYYTVIDGTERMIDIEEREGVLHVRLDDEEVSAKVDLVRVRGDGAFSLLLDGQSHGIVMSERKSDFDVTVGARTLTVSVEDERTHEALKLTGSAGKSSGPVAVKSVMPGIVREVRVAEGDVVEVGTPLLILEAMKMQNEVRAPRAGTVTTVHIAAESVVAKNDKLIDLE